MIRIARVDDAPAVQAIYAPHVESGVVTFETEVPSVAAIGERMLRRLRTHPWLVWEDRGRVVAYAYASRFRDRAAYDWIAETSIYVHPEAQRRGVARRLYGVLLEALQLQGIYQAVGVITLPGPVSVAMHEAMGFVGAGVWRRSGYKLGQWWDVGVWQKELALPPATPLPPTPFPTLAETAALRDLLRQPP